MFDKVDISKKYISMLFIEITMIVKEATWFNKIAISGFIFSKILNLLKVLKGIKILLQKVYS